MSAEGWWLHRCVSMCITDVCRVVTCIIARTCLIDTTDVYTCNHISIYRAYMGWLRLVGSLKLQVSFAREPYKRDYILQKRPIFWKSLQIIATPCVFVYACAVRLCVLRCVRVCVHECEQTSRCASLLGSTSRYLCALCVHSRAAKCQICSIMLQVAEYIQVAEQAQWDRILNSQHARAHTKHTNTVT